MIGVPASADLWIDQEPLSDGIFHRRSRYVHPGRRRGLNTLPAGSTLIVLPDKPGAARAALERVSRSLAAHGSRVTTIEQHERQPQRVRQETVVP